MTLAGSRAKRLAGGGPLERRVRQHFFALRCSLTVGVNELACQCIAGAQAPQSRPVIGDLTIEQRQKALVPPQRGSWD